MRAPDFVIHGDFSGSPPPPPPPRVVGRNAPFGPSLNLFRRKDVPPPKERGLLPFVKKALNAGPTLLRSVNSDEVISSLKRLVSLVGNAVGIFGAGYIGVQLVSVMWKRLCEERERWRIRSSSEAFARATFEEAEGDSSSSSAVGGLDGKKGGGKGGGRASSSSTPSLEELHADQEEMWRVIHNIYKDQADKLAALESASAEFKTRFETVAGEAEAALSLAMAKLTMRLEGLEGRCEAIAAIPVDTITATGATGRPTAAELEALRNELRRETEKHANAINALRLEVPSLLEQHDKVVVSKLQQFGEDVKKLILAAGNRSNASPQPGKPKSKSKPEPKPSS